MQRSCKQRRRRFNNAGKVSVEFPFKKKKCMSDIVLSGKKWHLLLIILTGPFSAYFLKFPHMCKQPFRRKKNLGVIFRHFKFDKQISAVVKKQASFSCVSLLRSSPYCSLSDQEKGDPRLHHFQTRLLQLPLSARTSPLSTAFSLLKTLQLTPVLASLHWLPVCFRIDLKLLFTCF